MSRRIWLPGLLVCAVAVSGCGLVQRGVAAMESPAESAAAEGRQNAASEQDAASGEERNPSTGQDEAGQPSTVDASKVIVKAVHDAAFAPRATVEIAVHSLKRRGKLADLVISLTPRVPEGVKVDEKLSPFEINGRNVFRVYLIDTVNLKRHMVVRDANRRLLEPDEVFTSIRIGQRAMLTYTFAAPPENVTKMDVHVSNFPPFTDVPLES
ncbi:hypothetical protein [Thermopolyspora flexuosa]|uniref:Uncharacterized protein n=1 Tax=Thermopolyspora flexuosa TaxID=103836 RepID=A0A543IVN5_9ACTN|nr:hypothetical protein [Thermopolyspora flexuosa]TQM74632.1 hypothetical protein FHX40_1313 [Thermopolyspora flexuosa]